MKFLGLAAWISGFVFALRHSHRQRIAAHAPAVAHPGQSDHGSETDVRYAIDDLTGLD
jgi:hypothetical protein